MFSTYVDDRNDSVVLASESEVTEWASVSGEADACWRVSTAPRDPKMNTHPSILAPGESDSVRLGLWTAPEHDCFEAGEYAFGSSYRLAGEEPRTFDWGFRLSVETV